MDNLKNKEPLIEFRGLTEDFYKENNNLKEILRDPNKVYKDYTRPYGIALIRIRNNLLFGIPIRTNMNHKQGFKTIGNSGLDYSKAVIIKNESIEITKNIFSINEKEYTKIIQRERFIIDSFTKYVTDYIHYNLNNKTKSKGFQIRYKFSTLKNYHEELGIDK